MALKDLDKYSIQHGEGKVWAEETAISVSDIKADIIKTCGELAGHFEKRCKCKLPNKPPQERYFIGCHKYKNLILSAHDCVAIKVFLMEWAGIKESELNGKNDR